jgi:hypothetical protein
MEVTFNYLLFKYDVRREDFDAILVKLKASQHPDIDTIHLLLSYLLFFYSNSKDSERLVSDMYTATRDFFEAYQQVAYPGSGGSSCPTTPYDINFSQAR